MRADSDPKRTLRASAPIALLSHNTRLQNENAPLSPRRVIRSDLSRLEQAAAEVERPRGSAPESAEGAGTRRPNHSRGTNPASAPPPPPARAPRDNRKEPAAPVGKGRARPVFGLGRELTESLEGFYKACGDRRRLLAELDKR